MRDAEAWARPPRPDRPVATSYTSPDTQKVASANVVQNRLHIHAHRSDRVCRRTLPANSPSEISKYSASSSGIGRQDRSFRNRCGAG